MSNELRALLARVEESDAATAEELRRRIDALQSRRQFGLSFERHTPESVTLAGRSISVVDKVQFLPSRGETEVDSDATWIVMSISGPKYPRVAALVDPENDEEAPHVLSRTSSTPPASATRSTRGSNALTSPCCAGATKRLPRCGTSRLRLSNPAAPRVVPPRQGHSGRPWTSPTAEGPPTDPKG